ncbi:hypothetical protein DI53_0256 [Sphingobacterium deserti]|uniref:Uncharacterized protein n=1 Tax=Sphingobacterium deserti TaxID=1229276 RepID=A0A0B8T444_9SPHI|nr:hypothetical protein DI53_0256 [Sphingobacterium deserti]
MLTLYRFEHRAVQLKNITIEVIIILVFLKI